MQEERIFATYIMGNTKPVLYVGMTNNLPRRVLEHKEGLLPGFTKNYNAKRLLWYEICDNPMDAIIWEKRLKNMSRKEKLELIRSINPKFQDLSDEVFQE